MCRVCLRSAALGLPFPWGPMPPTLHCHNAAKHDKKQKCTGKHAGKQKVSKTLAWQLQLCQWNQVDLCDSSSSKGNYTTIFILSHSIFHHIDMQKPSKIKMVFYCYNKTLQSTSSMSLYNANPGVVFAVAWAQTAGLVLAWTIKSQNPNQTFLSLVSLIWLSCSSHVGSCPTSF